MNRQEELRIQALGAAISRRDWHATETAHAGIRDAFYAAQLEVLKTESLQEQAARTMPLIGPMLDALDGMSNDERASLRSEHFGFYQKLRAVADAMEAE